MDLSSTWIVVPAYNEGPRISTTLRALSKFGGRVVVVDDGSNDETGMLALAEGAWLLRHPINCGQGACLQTGIEFALLRGAEAIITFDADGQHQAGEIESLASPVLRDEVDVVLGSRFLGTCENLPATRWLVLKLGVVFTRLVSGIRVTDTHNGFRALSAKAARSIRIREPRMSHASEILHEIQSQGLRYCERPVTIRYSAATLAKGQTSLQALRIAARFLVSRIVP